MIKVGGIRKQEWHVLGAIGVDIIKNIYIFFLRFVTGITISGCVLFRYFIWLYNNLLPGKFKVEFRKFRNGNHVKCETAMITDIIMIGLPLKPYL